MGLEKKFWLRDEDLIAPQPNPAKAGVATDPASLEWLLEEAQTILQGQETLFRTDLELYRRSEIHYYLDETIFPSPGGKFAATVFTPFRKSRLPTRASCAGMWRTVNMPLKISILPARWPIRSTL
jgi:hypothetical protein